MQGISRTRAYRNGVRAKAHRFIYKRKRHRFYYFRYRYRAFIGARRLYIRSVGRLGHTKNKKYTAEYTKGNLICFLILF